jgi:hypothetical protein
MGLEVDRVVVVVGALAIALYLLKFLRYPKGEKIQHKSFFWLFIFFAAHHLCLLFTLMLSSNHRSLAIVSFEFAMFFYFFVLGFAIKVLEAFHPKLKGGFNNIVYALIGIGTAALMLYAYDPVLPFAQDKYVIWGTNKLFGMICGLAGFAVGVIWATTFLEGWSKDFSISQKVKLFCLIMAGLLLGISNVPFFIGTNPTYLLMDNIFTLLGITCSIIAVFLPQKETSGEI